MCYIEYRIFLKCLIYSTFYLGADIEVDQNKHEAVYRRNTRKMDLFVSGLKLMLD